MDKIIGFDELHWLQEIRSGVRTKVIPETMGVTLLARGLIERKGGGFSLTARGRIALAKLS